ncbi:hypothetical protein [Limnoglobus roseus]|nr:hypothetical protein [Limnoglobus roseus]
MLAIELTIVRDPSAGAVRYSTLANVRTRLTDTNGKVIRHVIRDAEGMWPTGRVSQEREIGLGKMTDVLVFDVPDQGGDLTLEIGVENQKTDPLKFTIPETMIVK